MARGKGNKRKGNNKKSLCQQAPTELNASDYREANKSDGVTNLKSLGQQAPTELNASDDREASKSDEVTNLKNLRGKGQEPTEVNREANKSDEVTNLKSLRGKGNKGKGNTKQSLGQPASTKLNASDDREAIQSDNVTNLKSLNQRLLITINNERKQIDELKNTLAEMNKDKSQGISSEETMKSTIAELKNELTQTRVLNENHEKLCIQLVKEKDELENNLKECIDEIKELQSLKDELNQTRILSDSHEKLCTQLGQEKDELENKLKECNEEIKELQWLKNELNQTRILSESHEKLCIQLGHEKNELENKVKECNDVIDELQGKMKEDRCSWDVCKADMQGEIVKLQNNLYSSVNERKMSHEKLCTQLGQEKNELENKVKECNNVIEELQGKMNKDRCSWDACKADMEGEIVKLQNKLDSTVNERKVLNQKHEELWAKHRNDKNELRKCNEGAKKLKAKMVDDKRLWDSERVKLEEKNAELQNETDEARTSSEKHEELCTQLRQEKIKMENNLKKLNDRTEKLNAKMTKDKQLWDSCKTKLEGMVAGLQNELNETRVLSQGHEELCTKLRQEKHDLENRLKKCNDINKELQEKMIENDLLFEACKVELTGRVAELQDELNETRKLCQKHEDLSTELRQENIELGNKLKESNDETKKLKEKITEDGCLWDSSKAELEGTVAGLQNELNETRLKHEEFCNQLRDKKKHLEEKLKEFDDETKELKAKMTEDGCLWDSSKAKLEGTVAGLENELNETRLKHEELNIKLREEKKRLEKKLKEFDERNKELHTKMTENASFWNKELHRIAQLKNELNETKILSQNHEKQCAVLREEKDGLQNKLKEYNGRIEELNAKMHLWDSCKINLEGKVAGLLNEKMIMSQEHHELCSHLTDEKYFLEHKLKECNDRNNKLHAKMNEDLRLWETCKADFAGTVAGLQNELDLMSNEGKILSEKYVQLYTECAFLKAQLGDYHYTLSSVEDKRLGLTSLSESNAKKAECLQTKVQLINNEQKELSQKLEELITENGSLKEKVENYNHKLDSVEREKKSLISMSERTEKRAETLVRENSSLKQKMHELQSKLVMWDDEGKQKIFSDDTLDSTEEKSQFLTSPLASIDKLVEDMVTEMRTVKQEILRLNEQNQVLQNEILDHKSLLQTQDGIVAELNAKNGKLKNEIEELRSSEETNENNARVIQARGALWKDQVKLKQILQQREEARRRDSFGSHKAFQAYFQILLDSQSRVSKCLSIGTKNIILPPNELLGGCPYGWCGGIV